MKSVMLNVFPTRIWIMGAQTSKLIQAVIVLLAWAASPISCLTYHGARAQTQCCKQSNKQICLLFSERHSNEWISKQRKVALTRLSPFVCGTSSVCMEDRFLDCFKPVLWCTHNKSLTVSKVTVEKLKEMAWTSVPEQNPCAQNNFSEKS